jgi:hypothetical protein
MVKAVGTQTNGDRFLILGLSAENLRQLQADRTILVELADFAPHLAAGEPVARIVLFTGATEAEITTTLQAIFQTQR